MNPLDITHPGFFQLGRITKPQGVQGELRALLFVDSVDPYLALKALWLDLPMEDNNLQRFRVKYLRHTQREEVILRLEGISDRNRAEELRGISLWLPDELLPKLRDDQFYYHEIINLPLQDARLGQVGTIVRVIEMPAQDLLEVACPGGLALVPLADAFMPRLDKQAQVVHMQLPQGLLDVYLLPQGQDEAE